MTADTSRLLAAQARLAAYVRPPPRPLPPLPRPPASPPGRPLDRPCSYRGAELGWVECGCHGRPTLWACASPYVPTGYCLLHATGKPMGILTWRDRPPSPLQRLRDIPVCAICQHAG